MTIALILVEIFTVIMQRNVCEKAFDRKPAGTAVQVMVWAAFYIISNVTTYFFELPSWLNMVIFSVSFFGVLTWLYEGSIRIKLVLVLFLCLIGMLSEVMVIIPELSEPPVRTLGATIPENESHIFR